MMTSHRLQTSKVCGISFSPNSSMVLTSSFVYARQGQEMVYHGSTKKSDALCVEDFSEVKKYRKKEAVTTSALKAFITVPFINKTTLSVLYLYYRVNVLVNTVNVILPLPARHDFT